VPREVIFLEELPRNPTGKILKRELREMDVD
jgi:fatty-acyl-CoA synthase